MSKKNNSPVGEQNAEKKTRSKKPLVALLLAALLGLGAYGGAQLYNENNKDTNNDVNKVSEAPKEKITIKVDTNNVSINDQKQTLPEKPALEDLRKVISEYFADKDMNKFDVVFVHDTYSDNFIVNDIKTVLNDLKISVTEAQ